jgi:hypothetical protein
MGTLRIFEGRGRLSGRGGGGVWKERKWVADS